MKNDASDDSNVMHELYDQHMDLFGIYDPVGMVGDGATAGLEASINCCVHCWKKARYKCLVTDSTELICSQTASDCSSCNEQELQV